MVQFNFSRKEANIKIVFYGPGLAGKTTNLEILHKKTPREHRSELTSITSEKDRTLFFDFQIMDLGETIEGLKTRLRLFTVPGQVFYNSTCKLVLQGADGIIFVADSRKEQREENLESWKDLWQNLEEHGVGYNEIPVVLQLNKRDMPNIMPVEQMVKDLQYTQGGVFEAVAVIGEGVFPTIKWVATKAVEKINADVIEKTRKISSAPTTNPTPSPFANSGKAAVKEIYTQEQAWQILQEEKKLCYAKIDVLDLSNKTFTEKITLENVEINSLLVYNATFKEDLCCRDSIIAKIATGSDFTEEMELEDIEVSTKKKCTKLQARFILKNVEIKEKLIICDTHFGGEVLWKNITMHSDSSVNIIGSSFEAKFILRDCKLGVLIGNGVQFSEIKWISSHFQGLVAS